MSTVLGWVAEFYIGIALAKRTQMIKVLLTQILTDSNMCIELNLSISTGARLLTPVCRRMHYSILESVYNNNYNQVPYGG